MPRSEWQFAQPKEYSVMTQFDLYCDKETYSLIATSMVFVCWAIGAVILGWVADKYGRKMVLLPSTAAVLFLSLISAFSPSFGFYAVIRVLIGFFVPGSSVQMFILISEFVGPKHRPLAGITLWLAFSCSLALLGLKAYFIRTWKMLMIACTAPYFFILLFFKFIPESTRWLHLHGRTDQAIEIYKKIAKFNKRELPDIKLAKIDLPEDSGNILNLFRPRKMTWSSLIQGYAWMVNGMVYYGVAFAADDLGGSMYRDYILSCLVEIPAVFLAIYLCNKIGRKKTVLIPTLIAGLACIAASAIPTHNKRSKLIGLRVFFGIFGKFCITMSFDSIYTWSVELYPTVIRAAGMGYLQVAARVGSALAPWVAKGLIGIHVVLPFSLMGGSAIICAVLLLKLPETAYQPTAETFDDLNKSLNKQNLADDSKLEEIPLTRDANNGNVSLV